MWSATVNLILSHEILWFYDDFENKEESQVTVGKTFQKWTCRESYPDHRSVKIMWFGCLFSEKKPKNTFKRDTFADFQLKTAISQSGMMQITWFL